MLSKVLKGLLLHLLSPLFHPLLQQILSRLPRVTIFAHLIIYASENVLEEKNGRGIFRRFFYFIPVKGPGSVNRVNRKKFDSAKGSSHLHEFVDIGRRKVAAVPTRNGYGVF